MDRRKKKKERLEDFRGFRGTCKHCYGPVNMRVKGDASKLIPDECYCFYCGQRYYVEITMPMKEFEALQNKQLEDGNIGWRFNEYIKRKERKKDAGNNNKYRPSRQLHESK